MQMRYQAEKTVEILSVIAQEKPAGIFPLAAGAGGS